MSGKPSVLLTLSRGLPGLLHRRERFAQDRINPGVNVLNPPLLLPGRKASVHANLIAFTAKARRLPLGSLAPIVRTADGYRDSSTIS